MKQKTKRLIIVGQNSLLNQSLRFTIEDDFEKLHTTITTLGDLSEWTASRSALRTVILVDDSDSDAKSELFELLEHASPDSDQQVCAALFNMHPGDPAACDAVRRGVRGLFFSSDPVENLVSGLKRLLDGDVSIPREILVDAAMERRRDPEHALLESHLTMREIQILSLVCTGATNDQIAQELCISPHTVKTHMYNIFPKIGVENRLHAALWATRNLGDRFDHQRIGGGAAVAVAHR